MVKDLASLVSHEFRGTNEQKTNIGNVDIERGQRVLVTNEKEDFILEKVSKVLPNSLALTSSVGESQMFFAGPSNRCDDQQNLGSNSDKSSLIPSIGRDNSISCLIHCSRADYGSVSCLNRNFHSLISSGYIYQLRQQKGVVEHWVYFSCQALEWDAFDPNRRRWMRLPKIEASDCFAYADKESLAVDTELLVFGRDYMSQAIYRYSLLTNTWTSGTPMNQERYLFGSASLGEVAILAGGCAADGKILSSAELYDSKTQTWKLLNNLKKPRKLCSGVFMDNKFYVIGGIGGTDSDLLTCGEEFDMETETWREIPNMSPVRTANNAHASTKAPPLIAVVNNELYAADHEDKVLRRYNKDTGTWITIGRLPESASSTWGWGLAFRACGDRLIVIGGPRDNFQGFIEINAWVPREGDPPQWELLGRKRSGNFVFNCAVMGC